MWFEESVVYQIYPLGFCGAPAANDGVTVSRLRKIMDWIPHLEDLGVTALYLCPVWQSDRHGYDTRDFRTLDCRLGTNEDLKDLSRALHQRGIRLILDGVFNHTGRGFAPFMDLLQNREGSRYRDWFCNLNFQGNNRFNDGLWYEGWEGHDELVKLNLYNPEVMGYVLDCVGFWMEEFKIDGLRLDVAYSLPHHFIRELRRYTRERREDFFLLGEMIHGDYNMFMNGDMLDSVTNYQAYKGLWSSFNSANMFEINYTMNQHFNERFPGKHPVNFVDNHDVNRIASVLTEPRHLPLVYGLLFAMPGIPCVYYGSEWGALGTRTKDDDTGLRPCFEAPEQNDLTKFIGKLARIHRERRSIIYGTYKMVFLTNRQLVFERAFEGERLLCAINLDGEEFFARFNGYGQAEDLLTGRDENVSDGSLLPAFSVKYLLCR